MGGTGRTVRKCRWTAPAARPSSGRAAGAPHLLPAMSGGADDVGVREPEALPGNSKCKKESTLCDSNRCPTRRSRPFNHYAIWDMDSQLSKRDTKQSPECVHFCVLKPMPVFSVWRMDWSCRTNPISCPGSCSCRKTENCILRLCPVHAQLVTN